MTALLAQARHIIKSAVPRKSGFFGVSFPDKETTKSTYLTPIDDEIYVINENRSTVPAYASASGDAICCGGGRGLSVEQRTNIDGFGVTCVTDFPRSLIEFQQRFPDEAGCVKYLFMARWPEGFVCPDCGKSKAWQLQTKRWTWECAGCSKQTSVTAGTIITTPSCR
jgi:hypothetical protein